MDDEVQSETPREVSGSFKINKKQISNVWKYFTKIGTDKDGFEKAVCNYCAAEYVVGRHPKTRSSYGTSHLGRHILGCSEILANSELNEQHGKSSTLQINQEVHREKLARAIVYHNLPYNFVEYEMIRDWINYISPDVVMHSRNTIVSDVRKMYLKEKEKLKQIMSRILNRVCLTSDVWTAINSEGYICLTAHFVDDNWRLVSKILNFC
ncbi:hypothetical protein QN277_009003 [Acacia crassicarpa]|uniref:BED-type domain-containing protein n=1 Tax=Acacia crassicarpa TaxID=499986 RepID=A0AAE1M804_9FABA|nr:hypothetical protein QN277_009003 [Acacia crassicarpa]